MSPEDLVEDVCQHVVTECVSRVMENIRYVLASPADSYTLTGSEIEALRKGDRNPLMKELCAISIYHFLRLMEGDFGAFEREGKQYRYKLTLETLDESESITLIPPDEVDQIENVFLAQMEDWREAERPE